MTDDLPHHDLDPPVDPVAEAAKAFDAGYYLSRNPDVADAGVSPWDHYSTLGWREGRDPNAWFSVTAYLTAYPDVVAAQIEPLTHYIASGRAEGRSPKPEPAPSHPADDPRLQPVWAEFDARYYAAANPDLDFEPRDAFAHFIDFGWRDLRDPTRWFSTRRYLEANPDVAASQINPFVHYILSGRAEGRPLDHDLGFRFDLIEKTPGFERHIQALLKWVPDPQADPPDRLIDRFRQIEPGAPVHVTISHDNYAASFGGVQLCIRLESQAMRAAGAVHVHLFPAVVSSVIDVERPSPKLGVLLDSEFLGVFEIDAVASAFGPPAADRRLTLAVHSAIAHRVANLVRLIETMRPSAAYYWLHDYSSLCSNYALMRNDAVFCGAPPPLSLACEICAYGPRRHVQLAEHRRLLEAMNPVIVAPSETALAIWRRSFPDTAFRAVVHKHAGFQGAVTRKKALDDGPLRVGFLGMPTVHKGWPVFTRLIRAFAGDPRYQFFHLSKESDPALPLTWKPVQPTARSATPMPGAVRGLNLDVALIWSLWPETFCFAAYEAVAGGAAILTNPDSGNVQDMVRRTGFGQVLEDDVALTAAFDTGSVTSMRDLRPSVGKSLVYSRMTADLILGDQP